MTEKLFKPGDRVIFSPRPNGRHRDQYAAKKGQEAVVGPKGYYQGEWSWNRYTTYLDIVWCEGTTQDNGGYDPKDFELKVPITVIEPSCGNCKFSGREEKGGCLACRRYPPTIFYDGFYKYSRTMFPVIKPDSSCGEFQPK